MESAAAFAFTSDLGNGSTYHGIGEAVWAKELHTSVQCNFLSCRQKSAHLEGNTGPPYYKGASARDFPETAVSFIQANMDGDLSLNNWHCEDMSEKHRREHVDRKVQEVGKQQVRELHL